MWYIISGKLMSLVVFKLLIKLYLNFYDLIIIDRFLGWFLIEHLFEDYKFSAGKLFLISEDFRTLIKNLVIIVRNFFFLAQAFNPVEFFFINLILIVIFIWFKPNDFTNFFRIFVLFIYYIIFQSFLLINYVFIFFLIKNFLIFSLIIFVINFYNYIFYIYLFVSQKINKYIFKYCIFIFKFFFYFLLNLLMCFILFLISFNSYILLENFIQEFFIFILIPYFYFLLN